MKLVLFNTFDFIFIFLPITFFAFFGLGKYAGRKASAGVLSFASLTFYAYWDVRYVPLLLLSILFNYSIGHLIEKASLYKRLYLFAGIAGNLSLLGYYKYTAFFLLFQNLIQLFCHFKENWVPLHPLMTIDDNKWLARIK